MLAQGGDGAGHHGVDALAEADFAADVGSEAFVGIASHEFQGLANARFGNEIEVRRLLELHGEGLLQGAVEDGIAGGVHEVSEQQGVFFSKRMSRARPQEIADA